MIASKSIPVATVQSQANGGGAEKVPREFRLIFHRHNREVLTVTVVASCLALVGWAVLYALVYWAALMRRTLADDARPFTKWLPVYFLLGAMIAVFFTYVIERIHPHSARAGKKFFRPFSLLEALLFVPQLTLTALQNLRAFVFLSPGEMFVAWQLAQLVAKEEPLPLHNISARFADSERSQRALAALQLLGVVKLRPEGDDWLLTVPNANARKICRPRVRLRV